MQNRARLFLLTVAFVLNCAPAVAQVQLKSRTILPTVETTGSFIEALRAAPSVALHGLATFSRNPDAKERDDLAAAGIRILSPFQGTTYRIRAEKRLDLRSLRIPQLSLNLIVLTPEDRVEPAIWQQDFARYVVAPPGQARRNYVLNADGTLNLTVRVHSGVPVAESVRVLQRHALSHVKQSDETWLAVVTRDSLRALAGEDLVQWIDAGPTPFLPENDRTRTALNVDPLQNFNVATGQVNALGGNAVQVGLFDKGADPAHDDLGARVIRDITLLHTHSTHMAGTIAGNGTLSNGTDSWGRSNGGSPYQWRGMAPLAQLVDADRANATDTVKHQDYIANKGMDLSNHSYGVSYDGAYDNSNETRDQLVRGDALSAGVQVPGRLHVYSTGNHGLTPINGGNQIGYFSLTKQVKNGLVVGAWDLDANRIDQTSSLGPTHDGRIKPDVVAPGNAVVSTGYCATGDTYPFCQIAAGSFVQRQDFYRAARGSSMASAATAGAIALVLEQYATTYGVNLDANPPLPSTLRAVMIHTARDIQAGSDWPDNSDGPVQPKLGPDFVTGWGHIDAQAAVNTVANRQLREDKIVDTCDSVTYFFHVPPGTATPVRITLAWDDVAGNPATLVASPKLVNDLDLVLVDPTGTTHYPWQLDQKILDGAGNVIPDSMQHCDSVITVQRQFIAATNPASITPTDPSYVNDPIPPGGVPFALRGRDHLNNVEVVQPELLESPQPPVVSGTWQARVSGFSILQGPQSFSLIGASFTLFLTNPGTICQRYPWLCNKVALWLRLCRRYPAICETMVRFPVKDRIHIQFADPQQQVVLPLDGICRYAISCPVCGAGALCTSYALELKNTGGPLRLEVYAADGRLVARDLSSRLTKRLRFVARGGEQYVIALSPGQGAKSGADYILNLQVK